MELSRSTFEKLYRDVFCHYPVIDWDRLNPIKRELRLWQLEHHIKGMSIHYGISRFVIVFTSFVLKIQMNSDHDNEMEADFYKFAEDAGYGYLFAPVYHFDAYGFSVNVMPTVENIDDENGDLLSSNFIGDDERDWLECHVTDLHSGNYGFDEYGNVVIFDYAMCSEEGDMSSENY